MANVKINDIPAISSASSADTVLGVENATVQTKRISVGQISEFVNNNFSLDNKLYKASAYYVDLDSGNDANDGDSPASPLATVQEAINRVFPAWEGIRTLSGQVSINVSGSVSTTMTESVSIPPFNGDGPLVISGVQDNVYASVTEAAPVFTPVASHYSLQDISFSGAPFTASDPALAAKSFVVPSSTIYPTLQERNADCFPVLENTTSTLRCPVYYPNLFFGFDHSAGAVCDVKTNRITWQPATNIDQSAPSFVGGDYCVKNVGGGSLVIQGFDFQRNPLTVNANGNFVLINSSTQEKSAGLLAKSQIALCRTIDDMRWVDGGYTDVVCCINTGTSSFVIGGKVSSVFNSISKPSFAGGYPTVFRRNSDVSVYALYNDAFFQIVTAACDADAIDVRSRGILVFDNGRLFLRDCSFENVTSSCIDVKIHSSVQFGPGANISGSAGNTSFGAVISEMSYIRKGTATVSVSGTSGELVVGSNPPQLWSAGGSVDSTLQLCAYIV